MSWPRAPAENVVHAYDAFVSYNNRESDIVEMVARRLEDESSLTLWKDTWELAGGDDWIEELPQAISRARAILAFVGPHGVGPWHKEELKIALRRAVRDGTIRLIPVALPGCPKDMGLPEYLESKHIVDLREISDWSMHLLRTAVVGGRPGRRDQFEKRYKIGALHRIGRSRLSISHWEVSHDRSKYRLHCRLANTGSDTVIITDATVRVNRFAAHPIEHRLVTAKAPIGETELSQTLYVPEERKEGSITAAPFEPARYLKSGEVEDVLIPIYVYHGFRVVLSVGIYWSIPDERLVRLTETGYVALGSRGKEGDEENVWESWPDKYCVGQHSLDQPYFVNSPDWPSHWPANVTREEWEHYGAGEEANA
jgi:hypothetical protein